MILHDESLWPEKRRLVNQVAMDRGMRRKEIEGKEGTM
jgi:hypothetical protein